MLTSRARKRTDPNKHQPRVHTQPTITTEDNFVRTTAPRRAPHRCMTSDRAAAISMQRVSDAGRCARAGIRRRRAAAAAAAEYLRIVNRTPPQTKGRWANLIRIPLAATNARPAGRPRVRSCAACFRSTWPTRARAPSSCGGRPLWVARDCMYKCAFTCALVFDQIDRRTVASTRSVEQQQQQQQ